MHAIVCSTFHGSDLIPQSANDSWWVSSIMRKSSVDWGVQAFLVEFLPILLRSFQSCLFGWKAGFRRHWVPPLRRPGVGWKGSVEFSVKTERRNPRVVKAMLAWYLENDVFQMPIERFDVWVCIHICRSSAFHELKIEASRRIPSLTTSLGQGKETKVKGLKLANLSNNKYWACVAWLIPFMLAPAVGILVDSEVCRQFWNRHCKKNMSLNTIIRYSTDQLGPFDSEMDEYAGGELQPERSKMEKSWKHPSDLQRCQCSCFWDVECFKRNFGQQSLDSNNLEYEPSEAGRGGHVQGLMVSLLASGEPGSEPRGLDNVEWNLHCSEFRLYARIYMHVAGLHTRAWVGRVSPAYNEWWLTCIGTRIYLRNSRNSFLSRSPVAFLPWWSSAL